MATTPERADEQLARLLVTLEELEGQFGEHEDFLPDILAKREETLELLGAIGGVVGGVERRRGDRHPQALG